MTEDRDPQEWYDRGYGDGVAMGMIYGILMMAILSLPVALIYL